MTWKRQYFINALLVYIVFQFIYLGFLIFRQDTHPNAIKFLELYKDLAQRLNNNAELDNSGMYKILYSKNSKHKTPQFDITLVSQCSSNHLHSIKNLFDTWMGPISVAVFSEIEDVEETIWNMAKFEHCNNLKDLELHLVLPTQNVYIKSFKYGYDMVAASDKSGSCKFSEVGSISDKKNYKWTSPYPVNLLRNVARSGSSTKYIMVIDIDMIPSPNLRSDFLNFAKDLDVNNDKEVYVVPVFETQAEVPMPKDKAQLLKTVKENQARPFYFLPCRNCQKYTKYGEWLSVKDTPGTRQLYEVEWRHPWEPFFIAGRNVPDFDERFKQYGMNRVSQICELHVAGYKFVVMDNLFLVHRGYKTLEGFHETKSREMEENRRLYARFKTELKYRYPESEQSC